MPSNEQRRKAAKSKLERQLANRAERARKRRTVGLISTVVGVVVVVGLVYWLANIGGDTTDTAAEETNEPLPGTVNCSYPASEGQPASKPAQAPETANITTQGTVGATLKLNGKDVGLTLDRTKAPCTVNSFASLAKQGYFNDTVCHRLVTQGIQVLQCGDPSGTGSGGPGYTFDDEVAPDLKYTRGTLAMANAGPNTNGSQFFLVYGDASSLPPSYTVFGTIGEPGLAVIDEIAKAGINTPEGQGDGKPKNEVKVNEVVIAG
ncbi:Peptidyl-prolyl cis-trans isomerase [Actinokineospora spheciospongiae]|uniref:Peptidyl-prolyl cis-trans isomerase n=1 Tax=Actinokineospora spheciospongiae TaxID=909613 RepID=W7IBB8_9PSEU|nr:peptidylprolyl isomerase [Actinokineospora spheciospongiae]EWC58065.1 Peptidyl-prolyl cis-trans isomerase [Actinokineospora spheciospongiae]